MLWYDTQIIGEIDPSMGNMPVIQPTTAFVGDGVFTADVYLADGVSEWYLNTVRRKYMPWRSMLTLNCCRETFFVRYAT